jgi:integrase
MARGKGEGTKPRRRTDGRYVTRLTAGGKTHSFYGKTEKEARDKLRQAVRAREENQPVISGSMRVIAFMPCWLEDSVKPSVAPKTYASYAQMVNLYVIPELGPVKLRDLTTAQLQRFINGIAARPARNHGAPMVRTARYVLTILRRSFSIAVRWGLLALNPATNVDPPKAASRTVEAMTIDNARALLAAFRGHRLEAFVTVALLSGARPGELLGLQWKHVDLNGGTIRIVQALQRVDGELALVEPKTVRSKRTLPISSTAIEPLRRLRESQDELGQWGNAPVFQRHDGGWIDESVVYHQFRKRLREAGLPPMRLYDLRHGAATLMLTNGEHPRIVMERLGHGQIALTMNTYSHVTGEVMRQAAERLEAALSG